MFDWDDDERWRFRGRMSGREAPNHNSYSAYRAGGSTRSWSKYGRSSSVHTSKQSRYAQRAVVQSEIKYAHSSGGLGTRRHLTYIQRDGSGRDGESPELFGPNDDEIERDAFLERSREDEHQFRIILSPERGHDLDLEDYVHDWVDEVEDDLDHDLDWAAAVHHNTDNPHAHLVVRGRDADGDRVFVPPDYLNNGLRHRAQDVATYHLGPRTPSQMQRAFEKQAELDHFTELDDALLAETNARNELLLEDARPQKPGLQRRHLARRLQHLDDLGLARRRDGGNWSLDEDLPDQLDQLARQKDVVRRLREADRSSPDRWSNALPHDRLAGRVVDRGIADELDDQPYAVVDGEDGYTRYIEPEGDRPPSPGQLVAIRKAGNELDIEPVDEPDLDEAIEASGPTWLDRRLHSDLDHTGESDLGDALHRAVRQRHRTLARRGLADEQGEIPDDLVKDLRDYERDKYARRLAEDEKRNPRKLREGDSMVGTLSERQRLRGGDVFVVRNDRDLAVVPANKFLDNHEQSRVRVERSKNKNGRLRTFVENARDQSRDR